MKQLLVTVMLLVSGTLFGQVKNYSDIPKDILEQSDKMGVDNSNLLNSYESAYFNVVFKNSLNGFDFTNKKVYFFGPGGLVFSSKQFFFSNLKKNNFVIHSDLYVLNESEKKDSGGYDAVITYWCKRIYSTKDLVKKMKNKCE